MATQERTCPQCGLLVVSRAGVRSAWGNHCPRCGQYLTVPDDAATNQTKEVAQP